MCHADTCCTGAVRGLAVLVVCVLSGQGQSIVCTQVKHLVTVETDEQFRLRKDAEMAAAALRPPVRVMHQQTPAPGYGKRRLARAKPDSDKGRVKEAAASTERQGGSPGAAREKRRAAGVLGA